MYSYVSGSGGSPAGPGRKPTVSMQPQLPYPQTGFRQVEQSYSGYGPQQMAGQMPLESRQRPSGGQQFATQWGQPQSSMEARQFEAQQQAYGQAPSRLESDPQYQQQTQYRSQPQQQGSTPVQRGQAGQSIPVQEHTGRTMGQQPSRQLPGLEYGQVPGQWGPYPQQVGAIGEAQVAPQFTQSSQMQPIPQSAPLQTGMPGQFGATPPFVSLPSVGQQFTPQAQQYSQYPQQTLQSPQQTQLSQYPQSLPQSQQAPLQSQGGFAQGQQQGFGPQGYATEQQRPGFRQQWPSHQAMSQQSLEAGVPALGPAVSTSVASPDVETGRQQYAAGGQQYGAAMLQQERQMAGQQSYAEGQSAGQMGGQQGAESVPALQGIPAIDVLETPDEIRVFVDAPGFDPDDVEVLCDDSTLTILAHRSVEETEEATWMQRERPTEIQRQLQLPARAIVDEAKATCEGGVCTITLPKSEEGRQKRIGFQ
jgi:HSP20 family protein